MQNTVHRELSQGLGEGPVVTNLAADVAGLGIRDRKHFFFVNFDIVRREVHLKRNPRIHLAIFVLNSISVDQISRVKNMTPIFVVDLEHRESRFAIPKRCRELYKSPSEPLDFGRYFVCWGSQ